MKGAVVLGRWWRGAAALSAALAVAAHLTENRTLAFVTVGICVALLIYGAPRTMTVFSSDRSLAWRTGDFGS